MGRQRLPLERLLRIGGGLEPGCETSLTPGKKNLLALSCGTFKLAIFPYAAGSCRLQHNGTVLDSKRMKENCCFLGIGVAIFQ